MAVGDFVARAPSVLVTSGGLGANFDLVRANWPERLGPPPKRLISGVPEHVDGRMLGIAAAAGGQLIGSDRMWHYTEGVQNWAPIWKDHGIRILPAPSSLWLDALGRRLPVPLFPGFDTLGTLDHIGRTGHDHTWFVLTRKIIEREFALSGSEQNPDLTGKSIRGVLRERVAPGVPGPIAAFMRSGPDFVVECDLAALVAGMNRITEEPRLDFAQVQREVVARDREMRNPYSKDSQVTAIHGARRYLADRFTRIAAPHRLLDPKAGPLIAVRLNILTRKTLGGLHTDLSGGADRGRRAAGRPVGRRRSGGLRRRRDARLPLAGGNLPRWLPVLGSCGRPRPGELADRASRARRSLSLRSDRSEQTRRRTAPLSTRMLALRRRRSVGR